MNKAILSLFTIILLHNSCFSMVTKKAESYAEYAAKARSLETVAQRYQEFLSQFGEEETGDLLPTMKELFTPDIRKIVNGTLVAKTIEKLHEQMSEAKKDIGIWSVLDYDSPVASVEENMVIAHFEIPTQKKGTIVVMKKLICDSNGLIQEINEVFNFKTN